MSMQNYSTVPSRNLIRAEGEMLKHAEPVIVLGGFGVQKQHPKRKTDTVVFRRLKPFNATSNEVANIDPTNFVTAEGTTPNANTISYTDVSVTLEQYAVLFKYSSKSELMYEDDIPGDMQKLTGETLGEVAELVSYGAVKSGSSVIYANGSTRAGLNSTISLNNLRAAARSMENNRGKHVTSRIAPGAAFGTSAVEPAYVVFIHTDMMSDVMDLPKYTQRVEYGTAIKPIHAREIGSCEGFRFVTSPLFRPFLAAGASVDTTGMVSAGGSKCDVYPLIVIAEDAWGHVSLKGERIPGTKNAAKTGITPRLVPAGQINHANPSGMFGYVGADFWYAPVRLNENWMTRIEACATDVS